MEDFTPSVIPSLDTLPTGTDNPDATREDAQPEKYVDPRQALMAEIAAKVNAVRDEGEAQPEPAATVAPEPPQPVTPPAEMKVKVKVDGVEQELPISEVAAGYQRASAANKRMEEAAALRKQIEAERQAMLAQQPQQMEQKHNPEQLKTALEFLVEGETDQAAELLGTLLANRPGAVVPVDEAEIAARIERKLADRDAWRDFISANPEFQEVPNPETGEVVLTPQRKYGDFLFTQKYGPQIDAGTLSYGAALAEVAREVKEVFSAAPTTTRPAAEARKQAIDTVPVATGRVPIATPQVKGPSDIIAEMRRKRGLVP